MSIIDKRIASQYIVEYILNEIQSGKLKKGSHLPTEHQLSEMLGVSRIPLREALCSLRTAGLLEARQGGGTYITSKCDPSTLGRMLYSFAILEEADINQILDIRLLIEPEAAALAALNADDEQKQTILDLAKQYSDIINQLSSEKENLQIASIDNEFHEQIAIASGNTFLWMIHKITDESSLQLNHMHFIEKADRYAKEKREFANHHLQIAKAIKNSDAESARSIMHRHLIKIKKSISKV